MHEAEALYKDGQTGAAKAVLAKFSLISTDRVRSLHGMLVPIGCGSNSWPVHVTMQGALVP